MDAIATAASIAGWLLIFQTVYWMNSFEATSFYVTLLIRSFFDILFFLILMFLCIVSFANALLILDKNKHVTDEDYQSQDSYRFGSKSLLVDSIVSQYFLGLGEFDLLGSENTMIHPLMYVYFLLATLVI